MLLLLDFKIKILHDAEVLSDYNNRRPNIIPLITEAEMLFEKESHRVDKLRKLSDKIVSTVSERTILLKGLKEQVKLFSQFDLNYQFIYLFMY